MEIISIFVATFVVFIVSGIYYSPRVFGKIWEKSLGDTKTRESVFVYFQTFVLLFLQFCIIAFFLNIFSVNKLVGAYIIVFLLWFMITSSDYIKTLHSGRSYTSYILGTLDDLLGLLVGVTILYLW